MLTVIGIIVADILLVSAYPIGNTCTTGLALPAGSATLASLFNGKVHVKLFIVPLYPKQFTPKYVTAISESIKLSDCGSDIDKLNVADDLLADTSIGVAAVFH